MSELLKLAEQWEQAGIVAAKAAANPAPWYHNARHDIAHAANCFTAAAALRAIHSTSTPGTRLPLTTAPGQIDERD